MIDWSHYQDFGFVWIFCYTSHVIHITWVTTDIAREKKWLLWDWSICRPGTKTGVKIKKRTAGQQQDAQTSSKFVAVQYIS